LTIAIPRLDRSTAAERGITLADFLVPITVGERTPTRLRHIALIVAGALVVALTAQIVIPTTPVPFTGQTLGVLVAAAIVGRLAELGWDRHIGGSLAAMAIGTAVIYAIGVPWLKVTLGLPWETAVAEGMTKFLVWDAAKLVVAAGMFPAAWWVIGRRPEDR